VEDATNNYNIFKFKLNELLEKKSKNPYSESELLENAKMISKKREELERLINDSANLDTEISNNIDNLEKFEKNIKKRDEIVKRFDNLVILEKLFKGQKFVEYVANFYLKALIAKANKRFTKLTKHQLSLEINRDGNFIVKDFLNGGRSRLLKTLSGGQTFQASFCIALALAESINTLNKQSDNFFFIDEGFGSLDKDSLRLVFDTLNTLRYEKRIIGVISHVEDFKREVDVSINIKREKKHGSIVKTSW
jgi:exonuclease SbcC